MSPSGFILCPSGRRWGSDSRVLDAHRGLDQRAGPSSPTQDPVGRVCPGQLQTEQSPHPSMGAQRGRHPGSHPKLQRLGPGSLAVRLSELGTLPKTSCLYPSQDGRPEGSYPYKDQSRQNPGFGQQGSLLIMNTAVCSLRHLPPCSSRCVWAVDGTLCLRFPERALRAAGGARGNVDTGRC